MFGIEWLRRGLPVHKEASVLMNEVDAIADAQRRALDAAKCHPDREPDSFRLTDATGKIVGTFPIGLRKNGLRNQSLEVPHRWRAETKWREQNRAKPAAASVERIGHGRRRPYHPPHDL